MPEIAIYGKGGIGKSTISANISAALGKKGKRVLQIGCDPKHDSTRFLLHGKRIATVLDYVRETAPDKCRLSDIVHAGAFGVDCVEAGGPEPGVGCAGRGILTTFELLDRLGIKENRYDAIIYDVLGDVVCGGFAVPIRRDYAEKVYIVTSGEFMSLYAANNILRGIRNYDQAGNRAGGIIFNSRGEDEEEEMVRRFCGAVSLPLIARIKRDPLFAGAEQRGSCLVEAWPDSPLAGQFAELARRIYAQEDFYPALPLDDEELEERLLEKRRFAAGKRGRPAQPADTAPAAAPGEKAAWFSKGLVAREPLHGCAFNGAMSICTQVEDSICIAHGPESCAHITYQGITSASRRFILERGIVLPYTSAPPVVSSRMNEGVMIFGGTETLREKLLEAKARKPKVIFVLTTCPSGVIGDDVRFVRDYEDQDTRIVPVLADGVIRGDFLQGIFIAYMEIARALIDRNISAEENTVNIVAEKAETNARSESLRYVAEILGRFGIKINCNFLCETSVESIRAFKRGKLSILAYNDYMGRTIRDFLKKEFGAEFLDEAFPVGFRESCAWVRRIGGYFGRSGAEIETIIADYEKEYREGIAGIKAALKGRRLMVVTYNQDIDWILQTACDLEMEIAFVGILNFSQDNNFRTSFRDSIGELKVPYENERRQEDLGRVKPDLLLTNYGSNDQDPSVLADTIPLTPTAGFLGGLELARRWSEIFRMNLQEGWRRDDSLFRKYYA
ncbi:MAG: AAA family ATPase [Spirochaetaceae bacterium]|jgi:nitrogenase iron protein|nr:AAA family ATPase [Spirochaetaceae bacterium]